MQFFRDSVRHILPAAVAYVTEHGLYLLISSLLPFRIKIIKAKPVLVFQLLYLFAFVPDTVNHIIVTKRVLVQYHQDIQIRKCLIVLLSASHTADVVQRLIKTVVFGKFGVLQQMRLNIKNIHRRPFLPLRNVCRFFHSNVHAYPFSFR